MTASEILKIFSLLDTLGQSEIDNLQRLGSEDQEKRKKAVISLKNLKSEINKFTKILEDDNDKEKN